MCGGSSEPTSAGSFNPTRVLLKPCSPPGRRPRGRACFNPTRVLLKRCTVRLSWSVNNRFNPTRVLLKPSKIAASVSVSSSCFNPTRVLLKPSDPDSDWGRPELQSHKGSSETIKWLYSNVVNYMLQSHKGSSETRRARRSTGERFAASIPQGFF